MKIKKSVAIAFLLALGFAKAKSWDDQKIKDRLAMVPTKVGPDDVPAGHEDLYKQLVGAKGVVELEGGEEALPPEKKEAPRSSSAEKKGKETAKPAAAGPTPKPADKKEKSEKKPAAPKAEVDALGSRPGTIAAKVNAVLNKDWLTDEEIATKCGLPLMKTRDRLYFGAEKGLFERRRLIQYRLIPATK